MHKILSHTHSHTKASNACTTNSPQHDDSSSVCVCLGIKLAPLDQEFRVKLSLSHTQTARSCYVKGVFESLTSRSKLSFYTESTFQMFHSYIQM